MKEHKELSDRHTNILLRSSRFSPFHSVVGRFGQKVIDILLNIFETFYISLASVGNILIQVFLLFSFTQNLEYRTRENIQSNQAHRYVRLMNAFFFLTILKLYFGIVDRFLALVSTSLSLLPLITDG